MDAILKKILVNKVADDVDAVAPLNEAVIDALMKSIKEVGLIEPIYVHRRSNGRTRFQIIAGRHRLEAFRRLKRKTIAAFVEQDETPEIERRHKIIEIDENYVRKHLPETERQKLLARQQAIYDEAHPEAKAKVAGGKAGGRGRSRNSKRKNCASNKACDTFTKKVAKETGRSQRAVQLDIQRAKALGEKNLDAIKGTTLERGKEQDALIKMPVEERNALIARAAAGEKVSAHEVLAQRPVGTIARSNRFKYSRFERDMAFGHNIDAIKGTSLARRKEQDALVELPRDMRNDLIKRALAGERVSAVAVLAELPQRKPASETEQEAVEPDSNVVVLSALPKPEALQNENADPSQQRTPPDAPSRYLDALAALRRIKGIDVSVVDTVPPRDRMAFKAAVHEASLRLDELKDAFGLLTDK